MVKVLLLPSATQTMRSWLALCVLAAPIIGHCSEEGAQASRCASLKTANFSLIDDAPTRIKEAKLVAAHDGLPEYCDVKGVIGTNIGFALWLPVEKWNGKLLAVGCGGYCGILATDNADCDQALRRGYACTASDQGNRSGGGASWAYNNPEAEIDYGYRAAHVNALSAKVITAHYYAERPSRAYFAGCSGGGRQALVEAQRFPADFDGIVSMEPGLRLSEILMTRLWNERAVRTKEGEAIFAKEDIETIHNAVLAKCDLNDGIKDRVIGDPRDCDFDPAELLCKRGKSTGCLTSIQIEAAKKIYAGPMTSSGVRITGRGAMVGSEIIGSMSSYLKGTTRDDWGLEFTADFFRYMAFVPDPGPRWTARDFDFDRDPQRLQMMDAVYEATNPDLRSFKQRQGKLILIQGLHDGGSPMPQGSIDYYEAATRAMGGAPNTRDFFRLFLVPGRNHCSGGDGAWAIDHLEYLEAWVEQGKAPDEIIAARPKGNTWPIRYPLPADAVEFTRPVYPYPARAHYRGSGDPNSASSFIPESPASSQPSPREPP